MSQPSAHQIANRLRRIADQLCDVADEVQAGTARREALDALIVDLTAAQRDHFGARPRARRGQGAKARILAYLLSKPLGTEITGAELGTASGIQEWARRVRELRVEDGWEIEEVGDSVYRLQSASPDVERAAQWRLMNDIRRMPISARERIERFLAANVGKVVNREQIDYVANIAEGIRRLRELRDEYGWPINSHIDEPDLRPAEYRLLSVDPADRRDPSQRLYPERLRERIFQRDNYKCQECGRDRAAALAAGDTRFYLEVHHTVAVADELEALPPHELNDPANLVTLCHADHLRKTAALQARRRQRRGD